MQDDLLPSSSPCGLGIALRDRAKSPSPGDESEPDRQSTREGLRESANKIYVSCPNIVPK